MNATVKKERESELYREFIKESFLKNYPEATQQTYRRIFIKSKGLEEELEKDLYDFNIKELVLLLTELEPLTSSASRTNGRIISSYVNWAIKNKLTYTDTNPIKSANISWFDQFVNKEDKLYISEYELQDIENYCKNAQDAIVFRLIFEGVQGNSCSELSNLMDSDIQGNVLHLFNGSRLDYDDRYLPVDWTTIDLINQAIKQRRYLKKNGEMEGQIDNISEEIDLVSNNFVIRNSMTSPESINSGVDKHTIYRRITTIRKLTGYPYLTVKNIAKSGMIKMGKDLLLKYGKLGKDQLEKVADRFRIEHTWYIKEIVNEKNIYSLYPEVQDQLKMLSKK